LIGATAFVREKFDKLVLPDKIWRFVWRKNSPVLSDFVKFLFDSAGFRDQIRRRSTGTSGSMKNISQAKVLSIGVGLPPMDRQEEFSDRLGHAWISRERSEASLLRMEALFSSLQHRAFTGQL
jgi:type I restriction enzyme S subunit